MAHLSQCGSSVRDQHVRAMTSHSIERRIFLFAPKVMKQSDSLVCQRNAVYVCAVRFSLSAPSARAIMKETMSE